jgi:hypothetical protein
VYCYNSKERAEVEEKSLSLEIAKAGIDEYNIAFYRELNEKREASIGRKKMPPSSCIP